MPFRSQWYTFKCSDSRHFLKSECFFLCWHLTEVLFYLITSFIYQLFTITKQVLNKMSFFISVLVRDDVIFSYFYLFLYASPISYVLSRSSLQMIRKKRSRRVGGIRTRALCMRATFRPRGPP